MGARTETKPRLKMASKPIKKILFDSFIWDCFGFLIRIKKNDAGYKPLGLLLALLTDKC